MLGENSGMVLNNRWALTREQFVNPTTNCVLFPGLDLQEISRRRGHVHFRLE